MYRYSNLSMFFLHKFFKYKSKSSCKYLIKKFNNYPCKEMKKKSQITKKY